MKSTTIITCCTLFASLFGFAWGTSFAQEPESQRKVVPVETKKQVEELFQKCFEHRRLIKSGEMHIVHTSSGKNQKGRLGNERTREVFLAFDEERQRVDIRDVHRYNPYAGNNTPFVAVGCIGCYENDNRFLVEYSRYLKKDDPRSKSVLSIFDTELKFKGDEASNLWTLQFSFIPQDMILFSTDRFPIKKTIEEARDLFFSNTIGTFDSDVTDVTITKEQYKETDCKKITINSTYSDGTSVLTNIWIAEQQGYALRKHSLQISGDDPKAYDEFFEVDVALDKDSGIWFPFAWHYERNDKGKSRYSEDGTIKDVVLNKPIPDKIFTMQDLDIIPAGVMVQWNTDKFPPPHGEKRRGYLLWDGSKIITQGMLAESLVAKSASETTNSRRIRVVIFVNVAVISLLCAIFLWRYYHRLK